MIYLMALLIMKILSIPSNVAECGYPQFELADNALPH